MDEKIGTNAIEKSLEIFTGKWKVIILFQIFQYETLRFSELQRLIPSITKKNVKWATTRSRKKTVF